MVVVLVATGGCTGEPSPFEGSTPSLDALGEHVLSALGARDLEALEGVRLTEREHNEVVWPELPASAPEVNFPVAFAWSNIETRNQSALRRIVDFYGDEEWGLETVDCRGATEVFETFEVLTDCWTSFHGKDSDLRYEAQLFKDVLVRGGGYKLFRYYDQEPRPLTRAQAP